MRWVFSLFLLVCSAQLNAADLRVAVASDLRFAMPSIEAAFEEQYPDTRVQIIYGSSGRFYSQISNGAPFDVYMSADIEYPRMLRERRPGAGEVVSYGEGQLALWQRGEQKPSREDLLQARRIAIANPQHAPYGERALQWLQQLEEWPQLENKLVYAESVAQVSHFVRSGSANIGISALALVLSDELKREGSYHKISPDNGYTPLLQGMIITARGADNPLSQQFIEFMQSVAARDLLQKAGFILPPLHD